MDDRLARITGASTGIGNAQVAETIWCAVDRLGLSFKKKPCAPPSKTARTWRRGGAPGGRPRAVYCIPVMRQAAAMLFMRPDRVVSSDFP
jgi:hypothetical protein